MQSDHTRRRPVRSFVRRAGRLTPSQQRALDEFWPEFGVDFEPAVLDLDAIFGRKAPRVLEIGFGNGETLVQQASENPGTDYLGIEVHEPGVGHCLIAAQKAGLSNLKLIKHDAIDVLQRLQPASVQRINLYFPDPWPKKRHHKRRIVQPSFLSSCAGILAPSGSLHVATDWANYAEHIDTILRDSTLFACAEQREHDGDEPLDRPMTKFERRGVKRGHRIWDWRFEKSDL
jgi:tRNA (guanine-N7-)-methyltransferase